MASLNLTKGSKLNLNKVQGLNLSKDMVFGLGFTGKGGRSVDLDSYVAVLDSEDRPLQFVYFGRLKDKGIKHNGDDTRGGGSANAPNETIQVNMSKLDTRAAKLVVGLFIYSGASSLGSVDSAFANLTDNSGNEVCRYNLKEQFSKFKSVDVAHVTKVGSEWEFTATGIGSSENYNDIKRKFEGRSTVDLSGTSNSSSSSSSGESGGFFSRIFGGLFN